MKEKLEKIKQALREYTNVVASVNDPSDFTPKVRNAGQPAKDAIALLDSIIAELDSHELVEKVYSVIEYEASPCGGADLTTKSRFRFAAKAAIEAITGERK